jgi:hypothetical protein
MDRGVFFFSRDGRVLARPEDGQLREATEEDRRQVARIVWPFQTGMWRNAGQSENWPSG